MRQAGSAAVRSPAAWLLTLAIVLIALNLRGPIVATAPVLGQMSADLGLTASATYAERIGQPGERVLPLAETGETAPYFALILLYKGAEPAILSALSWEARR